MTALDCHSDSNAQIHGTLIKSRFSRMPIEPVRDDLLDAVYARFGWQLLCYGWLDIACRNDVSVHGWYHEEEWKGLAMTNESRVAVRQFVNDRKWQFSRNPAEDPSRPGNSLERVYLAPMIPVLLENGYHATRRVSEGSIREIGLLPSSRERQTTERRLDCEGNIYVCEQLGKPSDAGARSRTEGAGTAFWWRDHLARNNRFNDRDWVILKLNLKELEGIRTTRDIWSETGVIIDNVRCVAPERITIVDL